MKTTNLSQKKSNLSFISIIIRLLLFAFLYFIGKVYYTLLQTNVSNYLVLITTLLSLLIVLSWDTTWSKKISAKQLFIIQIILAGLYLLVFFVFPSYKCGAFTKGGGLYSCDCIGIKKDRIWNFTNRCIGIRTKCYLGSRENIYYEKKEIRIVKNEGNEVPCEGSLEFFK